MKYTLEPEGSMFRLIRCSDPTSKGGLVAGSHNLSQEGSCWIRQHAKVYDDALVSGSAIVEDYAEVYGNARVRDRASVGGDAKVYDNAEISGLGCVLDHAQVYGDAHISSYCLVADNAQVSGTAYIVTNATIRGNAQITTSPATASRSDDYTFTLLPYPNGEEARISAGCRLFTFAQAWRHWCLPNSRRYGTTLGDETREILIYLACRADLLGLPHSLPTLTK